MDDFFDKLGNILFYILMVIIFFFCLNFLLDTQRDYDKETVRQVIYDNG